MKKWIYFTSVLLLILIVVLFLTYIKTSKYNGSGDLVGTQKYKTICGEYEEGQVMVGSKVVSVDIADDQCKLMLGLSGKTALSDAGMIFVFPQTGSYGFWMKDMNFSLDIIWIDDNYKVSGIVKNLSPDTYSKSYGQQYTARYVLEVPAGFADSNNIKAGDEVIFYKN